MKAATPSTRPRHSSSRQSGAGSAPTAETRAFLALLRSFAPAPLAPPPVRTLADLTSSLPFAQVLSAIDPEVFSLKVLKSPPRAGKDDGGAGDWVSQYNGLRRVYRALVAYGGGSDGQEWSKIKLDLAGLAKGDTEEALKLCRVLFAVAIQVTPGNELLIGKIQTLDQADQQALMVALEPYLPKVPSSSSPAKSVTPPLPPLPKDVDGAFLSMERDRLKADNEMLEAALGKLAKEHESLQAQLEEARAASSSSLGDSTGQDDSLPLVHEFDRLKAELRQSEDNLTEADTALDRQTRTVENMTKRIDELNSQVKVSAKLKDQLDELKHASDRLQKSESANKKLSKKLEESADLRRQLKTTEEENARLVDRNAAMEDDLKRGASLRTLADSYKSQVADLEGRDRAKARELSDLRFSLEQTQSLLQQAEAELTTQRDEVELTRERIQELELGGSPALGRSGDARMRSASEVVDPLAEGGADLEDALSGRSKTDLKLQVKRLERELAAARSPGTDENSRVLVLENLLDDAKRMKERYEQDYLGEHKAVLGLKSQLEKIRSGKAEGDSSEQAMALRLRLNEAVDELDKLKLSHAALEVKSQQAERDLVVAKADLNLVNKDQIDILHSLRASVNEDKAGLYAELRDLKERLKEMGQKERMHVDQINSLLVDKVDMQGNTIAKREAQLERERAFGDLRVSLAGKDIPEDVKARLLDLQDEKVALSAEAKALAEKLKASEGHVQKAKKFIREQDAMLKEAQKVRAAGAGGEFAEAQQSYERTIAELRDEVATLKRNIKELDARYRHEFHLVFAAYQDMGAKMQREHVRGERKDIQPSSWLGQQRKKLGGGLRRE